MKKNTDIILRNAILKIFIFYEKYVKNIVEK